MQIPESGNISKISIFELKCVSLKNLEAERGDAEYPNPFRCMWKLSVSN